MQVLLMRVMVFNDKYNEKFNYYDQLFKDKPHIIQKTDNDLLFQFSLEEYKKYLYSGLEKNEDYLGILKGLLNDEKYRPFYDVIENIILNRKTIEQENFLI